MKGLWWTLWRTSGVWCGSRTLPLLSCSPNLKRKTKSAYSFSCVLLLWFSANGSLYLSLSCSVICLCFSVVVLSFLLSFLIFSLCLLATFLLFIFQILFQIRCQRYWPEEGELREYGLIKVHLQSQVNSEMYTVRTFNIQCAGVSGEKIVKQFHYTAWPEFGVPKDIEAIILFVKLLMKEHQPDLGPMVVHCRLAPPS